MHMQWRNHNNEPIISPTRVCQRTPMHDDPGISKHAEPIKRLLPFPAPIFCFCSPMLYRLSARKPAMTPCHAEETCIRMASGLWGTLSLGASSDDGEKTDSERNPSPENQGTSLLRCSHQRFFSFPFAALGNPLSAPRSPCPFCPWPPSVHHRDCVARRGIAEADPGSKIHLQQRSATLLTNAI